MADPQLAQQLGAEQTHLIWLGAVTPSLSVISPISIDVTRDDEEEFVADSAQFLVHGVGGTVQDAIADFFSALQEYVELVRASAEAGDPFDQEELLRVESCIRYSTPQDRFLTP